MQLRRIKMEGFVALSSSLCWSTTKAFQVANYTLSKRPFQQKPGSNFTPMPEYIRRRVSCFGLRFLLGEVFFLGGEVFFRLKNFGSIKRLHPSPPTCNSFLSDLLLFNEIHTGNTEFTLLFPSPAFWHYHHFFCFLRKVQVSHPPGFRPFKTWHWNLLLSNIYTWITWHSLLSLKPLSIFHLTHLQPDSAMLYSCINLSHWRGPSPPLHPLKYEHFQER